LQIIKSEDNPNHIPFLAAAAAAASSGGRVGSADLAAASVSFDLASSRSFLILSSRNSFWAFFFAFSSSS